MAWFVVWCSQCHRDVEARIVATTVDDEGFSWEVVRCRRGGHLFRTNRFP
jgi:hypothetical protein